MLKRLAGSTALFFALPLAFLAAYVLIMHAPTAAVWLHLHVIAVLAIGLAGSRILISLLPVPASLQRLLSAVLLCCVFTALLCLYAGSYIGLKYWSRVATLELATTYVVQAPALLRALSYPLVPVFLALAFLPLVGVFVAYQLLRWHDWVPAFRARIPPMASLVIAGGLLSALAIFGLGFKSRDWGRQGEPLSLSLYPYQANTESQSHGIDVFRAAQLQREDERARSAYVPAAANSRSNVILIVVDALRADHLSLLGYGRRTSPHLEVMRERGAMVFATSAVTACNESSCGLRALASSRYVDRQSESPMTVHDVLKKHGYRVHLVFSGDHVNFYGIDGIYGAVDSYFDGASQTRRYVNDDRLVIDRLGTFAKWDGTPTMFHFHLMSTHALGERFAETPEFGPSRNYLGNSTGSSEKELPTLATNHYDRGVLQTDRIISQLLSQLDEQGYMKDAVVVITGDHGESLGERGRYGHSHSVWQESLRVPFVVLAFGRAGSGKLTRRSLASQVDIAPTLLDLLGMPQPTTWQGASVRAADHGRYVYFQQAQLIGLIDKTSPEALYKHWVDTRSGQQYTFNLTADPAERTDLTDKVPLDLRRAWRDELLGHAGALPKDMQEKLRDLALH